MKLTVNVTRKHIDEGVIGQHALCPVALALMEQHPPKDGDWFVLGPYVDRNDGAGHKRLALPTAARAFTYNFDRLRPVAPFTFEIEVPE